MANQYGRLIRAISLSGACNTNWKRVRAHTFALWKAQVGVGPRLPIAKPLCANHLARKAFRVRKRVPMWQVNFWTFQNALSGVRQRRAPHVRGTDNFIRGGPGISKRIHKHLYLRGVPTRVHAAQPCQVKPPWNATKPIQPLGQLRCGKLLQRCLVNAQIFFRVRAAPLMHGIR